MTGSISESSEVNLFYAEVEYAVFINRIKGV